MGGWDKCQMNNHRPTAKGPRLRIDCNKRRGKFLDREREREN